MNAYDFVFDSDSSEAV